MNNNFNNDIHNKINYKIRKFCNHLIEMLALTYRKYLNKLVEYTRKQQLIKNK